MANRNYIEAINALQSTRNKTIKGETNRIKSSNITHKKYFNDHFMQPLKH